MKKHQEFISFRKVIFLVSIFFGLTASLHSNSLKSDFNGDGIADILWRHTSGQYLIFFMNADGSREGFKYGYVIPTDWQIADTNDFNGDGIADILWRHTSGQYLIFFMNADGSREGFKYGYVIPTDWQIADTNDFNGDGIADILWRHQDGQYLTFFMNADGSRKGYKYGYVISNEWQIAGTNDFNGDGIADILWRHTSGQYLTFFMNADGSRKGFKYGYVIPTTWKIADSNDFNGDGIADILWRHTSGQYLIFFMNADGSRKGYKYGYVISNEWQIEGTNDFNGDGIADILWRHTDGQYLTFFMNADGSRKGYKYGYVIPTEWKIEPHTDIMDKAVILSQGINFETPRISLNAKGDASATWIEDKKIYASQFRSNTWNTPELIQSDTNSPALANKSVIDTEGNVVSVWVQTDGLIDKIWVNRFDMQTGWETAQRLTNAIGSEDSEPQIAMDSQGNALIIWTDRDHINVSRYNVNTNTFSDYTNIAINGDRGDHLHPSIKMDALGNATAAWTQYDQYSQTNLVWIAQYNKSNNQWSSPASIFNESLPNDILTTLTLGLTPLGKAMIVWTSNYGLWTGYYNGSWIIEQLLDSGIPTTPNIATQKENLTLVYADGDGVVVRKFDANMEEWDGIEKVYYNYDMNGWTSLVSASLDSNGNFAILVGTIGAGETYLDPDYNLNFSQKINNIWDTTLISKVGDQWDNNWHTNEGIGLSFDTTSYDNKTGLIWKENDSIKSLIY